MLCSWKNWGIKKYFKLASGIRYEFLIVHIVVILYVLVGAVSVVNTYLVRNCPHKVIKDGRVVV